ncbi:MAG TPA: FecR domain-containing protein, partial [Pseudorhodoferax sp.]|nr:FecR domain-containing protein [Pseudorhodoferax sp.]
MAAEPLASPAHRPPPRRLVAHALSLIGRQQHGSADESAAARDELARWRQAAPAHAAAFETATRYWQATEAGALRGEVDLPARTDLHQSQARRRALTLLGLGGLIGVLAAGGRWAWLQPTAQFALRTGQGQQQGLDLPDGSRIDLAANSAGQLRYHRDRRLCRLLAGEMRFDVRRDPRRPFVVETAFGSVEVLGTVFSVSVRDDRLRVAVARGRVAVRLPASSSAGTAQAVLEAGQAVEAGPAGLGLPTPVRAESVGAWREGWLVFQ